MDTLIKIEKIIKTIHTEYEIKENPIFSNINKNGIRLGLNVNGIVYIKKQYDSNNRIYLKNVYFYDSLILMKENNKWSYSKINLVKTLKNNAIFTENKIYELPKDDGNNYCLP